MPSKFLSTTVFFSLAFFLIFFLAGCSVRETDLSRTAIKTPDQFSENITQEFGLAETGKWWKRFQDPVLDELVDRSLNNNLDIHASLYRLEKARALYRETNASRFPYLTFDGQAARSNTPSYQGDVIGGTYSFGLEAGYELDLWKKYSKASEAAKFDANASLEDVRSLYLTVSANVADLYFLSVEQRAQIKMLESIITAARDMLSFVERRYRGGVVEAVDLFQARQGLESARARKPLYETELKKAEHALSILCGSFTDYNVTGNLNVLPEKLSFFKIGIPAQLIHRRPDVRKAFMAIKAGDARVASAVADLYPAFRIGGSVGRSQSILSSSPLVGEFWNLFAGLTQPLFEGGRRVAAMDFAKAEFEESILTYKKDVLNAVNEVEDSMAQCRGYAERIKSLEAWVEAVSYDLLLSKNRYFMGVSDYLPVLTAQQAELEAKSQLINARRIYISSFIALARSLGGDWMDEDLRLRGALKN